MPENIDIEKRDFLRTSLGCQLSVSSKDMPVLPVTALNVSASGIYCVSTRSIGELTRVDLLLRVDDGEEIPARAVVIREEQLSDGSYGLGLFFTKISEDGRAIIIDYTSDL
ncbi:MAG: PilZ domain-containing protein [Candidatus Fermentibacteraceae bacterium]|nr:PilZ domain-containing protein [Candidatus Fermentibacteraceae bacterium]